MNQLPFRIRIGVTGHRNNLPDTILLKNKVREVLGIDQWNSNNIVAENSVFSLFKPGSISQLKNAKNTPVAFSIMTALAEGADRIVAETLLEIESAKIEVVLPLTKEDYLQDFKTTESKNEFERLLKKDLFAITLRSKNIDDEFEESKREIARDRAYFNAGKYIVDNCDVLIAIWNGAKPDDRKGKGGTFYVIEYAKKIKRPLIILNSITAEIIPVKNEKSINASAIRQIDHFNSYKVSKKIIEKYTENVFDEYFNKPHLSESKNFNPSLLDALKEGLIPYYARASLLAKSFKNSFKWTGQLTYLFSTLAVILLVVSLVFNVFRQEAFYIEFILLLFIFSLITVAHKKKVHSGWLEYRYLVERIRAAPYFFLAGRGISGIKASPNSGKDSHRGQWAIMAFSEIWYQLHSKYQKQKEEQKQNTFNRELISYVQQSWIGGQIAFQEKYFKRNSRKNKILETGGKIIFATAISAALTHIILSWLPNESQPSHLFHNILTLLAISLPTIAAAFEGLRRQSEYSRNKNRSLGMIAALQTMRQKYLSAQDEDEFYRLLHETDMLMLSETQEWMMLMIPSELEYVT